MTRIPVSFGNFNAQSRARKNLFGGGEEPEQKSGVREFAKMVGSETDTLQGLSDEQHARLRGREDLFADRLAALPGETRGRIDAITTEIRNRADADAAAIESRLGDIADIERPDILGIVTDRVNKSMQGRDLVDEMRRRVGRAEFMFQDTAAKQVEAMSAGRNAAIDSQMRSLRNQAKAAGSGAGVVMDQIAALKAEKNRSVASAISQAGVDFNNSFAQLMKAGDASINQAFQAGAAVDSQGTGQILQAAAEAGRQAIEEGKLSAQGAELQARAGQIRRAADDGILGAVVAGEQAITQLATLYPELYQMAATNPPAFVSEVAGMLAVAELGISSLASGAGLTAINSAFGVPTTIPKVGVFDPDEATTEEILL